MAGGVELAGEARRVDRAGERFPFTKFLAPAVDERMIVDGVVGVLDDAVARHPLTVLSAPAGAGKTTALAAWTHRTRLVVAWIRLTADDRDPPTLAAVLLAGIRRAVDGFGVRVDEVLAHADVAGSVSHLVTSLVNDLGEAAPVALVLDDLHELTDPDGLAFLDALLDHLPADVRVVVGTRTEPDLSLPRRRVRAEVTVLGPDVLRLDREAVRQVLAGVTEPTDALVDSVTAGSGGWAAAVRLAAARVAAHGVTEDPVAGAADVSRFLAEEVLDVQPGDVRRFLLATSILEELDPEVCAAVTGRDDAATLIAELARRNLFLTRYSTGGEEAWRYHDLFRSFLLERLAAERSAAEIAALHRRAAAALPPARSVPHLLAAGEHDAVIQVATDLAMGTMDSSLSLVVTPWLEQLPQEALDRHHRAVVLLTWRDETLGRSDLVRARLEPLHGRLLAEGRPQEAAETAVLLAVACMAMGDLERTGALLDEILATDGGQPWVRGIALGTRMWWCYHTGDWPGMAQMAAAALETVTATDDPGLPRLLAEGMGSQLLFADGGHAHARSAARVLGSRLGPGDLAATAALRTMDAGMALLALDLDAATAELDVALTTSTELGGLAWTHQDAEGLRLVLALARGEHDVVREITGAALPRVAKVPVDALARGQYGYAAVRSAWRRGERQDLAALVGRWLPVEDALGGPGAAVARSVAAALLARAEGNGEAALATLAEGEAVQRAARRWLGVGLPGLERASLLLEQGRTAAALEAAEPTLAVAAEVGAGILLPEVADHRPLLQRCAHAGLHATPIRSVLAAVGTPAAPAAVAIPGSPETLSSREVEVLGQVALGRSNREIAAALHISEVTVKSHLTRILRKLQATSRTHAVARARELHLL